MLNYSIYVVLSFYIFNLNQLLTVTADRRCRCLASDPKCWPNATAWLVFDQSVDGHLLYPKPSAAVCNGKTYNATACAIVTAQWSNSIWRSDQAGAMQNHNWEKSSCSISFNSTGCNQGAISVVAVNATWSEHVQATVRFAATNNLRLVIKSTGHDYLGRSTAAGSLLLWLHYMKNMTLIPQYSSCDTPAISNAIRIGAGVQWHEVYKWLNEFNLTAIGGASGTVSVAGGYLQGGGHSPLSHWKGMAADQVLEFDVVMADGRREVVNECQNSDLFWALRGGGGGTYAVVLSAVLRTYPSPSMAAASFSIFAPNQARYTKLIEDFLRLLVTGADVGWASYFFLTDLTLNGVLHVPNGNLNDLNNTLYEFAARNPDLQYGLPTVFSTPSFYDYFVIVLESSNPTGSNVLLGSRLIPDSVVRNSPEKVAQVFAQTKGDSITGSTLAGHLVAGGEVSIMSNVNNSVNPGWRTALLHMVYAQGWLDTTSEADQKYLAERVSHQAQILGTLSGDSQSTCYANEADPNEMDWQEKFYGSKTIYNQLKLIKQSVDPDGLFVCKNCVGSEDWTTDLNCPKTSTGVHLNLFFLLFFIEFFILIS